MKLYLQTITENFQLNNLPEEWLNIDLAKFSNNKALFDYQQNALKNAIKALYKYFIECKQNKEKFFKLYINNGLTENLDIKLSNNKNYKIFEEFDNHYIIQNNEIRFYHFINRMSFWMATGSGKTLVIVKLIELLAYLIQQEQIPKNDILFLTYREDLIEQFRYHVDEFNSSNN
ncbi:MAG: DEAD/DEAH box helicase family protein, partial [Patescibacteria group bacterium]|nr:DEAD/DEAH box helicase family protein [Patescibacteria group bacterium]